MFKELGSLILVLVLACNINACTKPAVTTEAAEQSNTSNPAITETGLTLLFLGDSLTEGYELSPAESYPMLVKEQFQNAGLNVEVINAGLSGDTTLGGLNRFQWYLSNKPFKLDFLFLALGANDGLRGLPLATAEANLRELIKLAQQANIEVVLAGMEIPPNYGKAYSQQFSAMYTKLATDFSLVLMPFLLTDVAGNASLNLPDGFHPNAAGYRIIATNVYLVLSPLITKHIRS